MQKLNRILISGLILSLYLIFAGKISDVLAQGPQPGGLNPGAQSLSNVETLTMPPVDREKLLREDEQDAASGLPPRFAQPIPVQITPKTNGTWESLGQGIQMWRLRILSPQAVSLNFGFTRYVMPPGGQLWLYTPDYQTVIGPFTADDNEVHGQLWTPLLPGDDVIIEVTLPETAVSSLELELTSVNHGYLEFGRPPPEKSGSCNLDVVCTASDGFAQVDPWRAEIRSVAVYSLGGGTFCTGALVNNTSLDRKPYFLTADHCNVNSAQAPSLVVYWNYQNSTCRAPGSPASGAAGDGQLNQFQTGSFFRADYGPSDMTLLELDDPVNPAFNVHFAGWDRTGSNATSAVAIHHPNTDEKRITFENDPTSITSYLGTTIPGDSTHVRVFDWDLGTTEPGSSGSPLFNQSHHIIGQLHGGTAACGNNFSDYYGRFSLSWTGGGTDATRLSNWLDPSNTGATVLDGTNAEPDFTLVAAPATQAICAPANAAYNLAIGSVLGYNDPVTLNLTGNPAGTTANFTPNPVTPAGASVLIVGNTSAAAPGSYNFQITGIAPTSTHTTAVRLDLFNNVPAALSLVGPANGATNVNVQPTLSWTAATQGLSYTVEIASDAVFSNIVYTATVAGISHTLATPLSSSTGYYWRVRPANACGAGGYSSSFSFTTQPLPGECTLGTFPNSLLSEGFEAGPAGWAQGTGGSGNTWALWGTHIHSGAQAWHATASSTASDQRLVSPPVTLPTGQSPLALLFWNYQEMEDRAAGGCYDGGILEISTDSGNSWTQLPNANLLTDPYNGPINASSNPLNSLNAWCGDPQDWLKSAVALNAYAGQTVNFRFRLGTDSSVGREGWTIDDVVVQSCLVPADLSLSKTVIPGAVVPGRPITYTLTFSNTGVTTATGVLITDLIPTAVLSPNFTSSGVAITPTGAVNFTWQVANLAPGQRGIITVTGIVNPDLENGTVITNAATLTGTNLDLNPGNNTSTASVSVSVPRGGPIYLPLILKDIVFAPDLVMDSLVVATNAVTVTIKNIGNATSINAFWVDVYLNPAPAPTHVNQTWPQLSNQGLVWGVLSSIPVNGTLTLTIGDPYYSTQYSKFSGIVSPGTPIWGQVDSVNFNTGYGSVLEDHEISGKTYNNIIGPISPTSAPETATGTTKSKWPTAINGQLPSRE